MLAFAAKGFLEFVRAKLIFIARVLLGSFGKVGCRPTATACRIILLAG
jgi:hypothetical protein